MTINAPRNKVGAATKAIANVIGLRGVVRVERSRLCCIDGSGCRQE
jgi:hypothetical protein